MLGEQCGERSMTEGIAPRSIGERCCSPLDDGRLGDTAAAVLAADFRLLSDPMRQRILDILAQHSGEVCVCDLEAALPVKQPTVSHHLRLLLQAHLVTVRRKGLWAHYSLAGDELEIRRQRLQAYLADLAGQSLPSD
jgi:ArsR family transcriptional regulator